MTKLVPLNIKLNENGKKYYTNSNDFKKFKTLLDKDIIISEQEFESVNGKGAYFEAGEFKVDVDTKDLNSLPDGWREWVKERLENKDTLIIETYKGYHIFAKCDLNVRGSQDKNNNIDTVVGGTVCPFEYSGKEETISYNVISDAEVIEIEEWDEIYDLLPIKQDTPDDDDISVNDTYEKLTLDEVESALSFIPSYSVDEKKPETSDGISYQDWIEVMASAFKATDEDVYEVLKAWSSKNNPEFNENEFDYKYNSQIKEGNFGKNISASKLLRWAMNAKTTKTIKRLEKASTIKDMTAIFKHKGWLAYPQVFEEVAVDEIAKAYQSKAKEIEPDKKTPRIDTIKNIIAEATNKVEIEKAKSATEDFIIAVSSDRYFICNKNKERIAEKKAKGQVVDYLKKETGIPQKILNQVLDDLTINISEVIYKANFTQKEGVKFLVKKHPTRFELDNILEVNINPLQKIKEMKYDEKIINDFTQNIWGDSLDEIIKLIALTVKYEHKKNLIAIIGGASIGKSSLGIPLEAPIIELSNFIAAMDSTSKGIAKAEIEAMMRCSIAVIDECSTVLPEAMKSMALGSVNLYGFGAGRYSVPLKCSILTSTHDTLATGADKQMADRMCLVKPDSKYSLLESSVLQQDHERYKFQTQHYIASKFKEFFNADTTLADLIELHDKFAVEVASEEIDDLIYDDVIESFNSGINDNHAPYSEAQGVYGVVNKTYLRSLIKDCVKNYEVFEEDRVINNVMKKVMPDSQKKIMINGKKFVKTIIEKNIVDDFEAMPKNDVI